MQPPSGKTTTRLKNIAIAVTGKLIPEPLLAAYLNFWARLVFLVRKPYIVGVTGTAGKTTTTKMIASVLAHPDARPFVGPVGHTVKNMNDDQGVPATLLLFANLLGQGDYPPSRLAAACLAPFRALGIIAGVVRYPKLFVLEFGAGWGSNLYRLTRLAPPDIAVVTSIGAAHLECFKTVEGVALEKMALVKAASPNGLVILGNEHDYVSMFIRASRSPVIQLPGKGVDFAEAATRAICRHLVIPDEVVTAGLRDFKPAKGRLNVHRLSRLTVIDDSYNANLLSMKYGLDSLVRTAAPGSRRVAILGFMAELGDQAPRYHKELGEYSRSRVDLLIGIGELAKHYKPDHWFHSSQACLAQIRQVLRPNDCVLIKGSSSAGTRDVVEDLLEHSDGTTPISCENNAG